MATSNDIKNGTILNIDGQLWQIVEFQHVKPGKGGAFVRTKAKNVITGKVVERTYNAGAKVEITTVDRQDMQFLYKEAADFMFMNMDTYEQVVVPATVVGENEKYLLLELKVTVALHDGTPLFIELPASVVLTITYTEPGLQGDRSNAGTKPATVETGGEIQVPLFVSQGEKVKVDTRTGEYMSRVSE